MQRGKVEARLVLVAVNNAVRNLNLLDLTYSSKSIIGSGGYRPEDVRDVMDIMKSGRWAIDSIITGEYPVDEIDAAIRAASDTDHNLNVVIHFQDTQVRRKVRGSFKGREERLHAINLSK